MKKILIILLLSFAITTDACAYNCMDKLARGAFNMIVAPLEFFQALSESMENHDPALGVAYGLTTGAINTGKRAFVGFFEVITFLVPIPVDYGPLIEEPLFLREKRTVVEEQRRLEQEQQDPVQAPVQEGTIE